jgi:transcription elongation factor Elf1
MVRTFVCPECGRGWKVETGYVHADETMFITCDECEEKLPQDVHGSDEEEGPDAPG